MITLKFHVKTVNWFALVIFILFPSYKTCLTLTLCPLPQVVTFGSVPLKTYLPDGDIDLTAFSQNLNLSDTWANQVRDMLESEEKNENAEFHVKEVQYIKAEVSFCNIPFCFQNIAPMCTFFFL